MAVQILPEEQISVFCRSLAMMLRSGVTMQEAVELFVQDGDDASPLLHSTAQQMKSLGRGAKLCTDRPRYRGISGICAGRVFHGRAFGPFG